MKSPNLLYKIKNFIKSLLWHICLGLPKSSQQLINTRYDICNECSMFDINNSQCLVCGCNISNKSIFMNKLAWADQKCPDSKW